MLFKHNYEANGVIYKRFDQVYKVYAFKSVVISAGTLNTAKILLSSGIGPAHQLNPLKVNKCFFFLNFFLNNIVTLRFL